MRSQFIAVLGAMPLILWLLGCGPVLLLPGGGLDGELASPPTDWSFSDETSTIQLETRPGDPYSVNVWAVGLAPALYVHAGAYRSTWVELLEVYSHVRVDLQHSFASGAHLAHADAVGAVDDLAL